MGYPTDNLSFGKHRIDNLTSVMHEDDARDLHSRRLDIDLDFGDGRAVAVGHPIYDDIFRRFKSRLQIAGKDEARRSRHASSDLAEPDFHLNSAFDHHMVTLDVEIGRIDLKQMTGN